MKRGKWESQEDRFIINNHLTMNTQEISNELNRSIGAVRQRCTMLCGKIKDEWEISEIEYLTDNYGKIPKVQIARDLGKSTFALERKIKETGLKSNNDFLKNKTTLIKWLNKRAPKRTEKEIMEIIQNVGIPKFSNLDFFSIQDIYNLWRKEYMKNKFIL